MAHAFALSGSNLISFDTATPTNGTMIAIAGLTAGETLVGIDFRPQNGLLYGLGVNSTTDTATLYAISTRTGFAAVVGTASSVVLTTDGSTIVDLPDPAFVGYGFDFNPANDRIRVTAGALNFRVNPNTGTAVDGDNGGGVTPGTNPDGSVNSATTTVDASAYTNNQPNNGGVTTLYSLDGTTNSLFIQNPPNAGTQTLGHTVTLGGSPLDFTNQTGFDIPAGVNAASNNAAVTTGSAFAVLHVGGTTGLYSINLVNGQATSLGNILNGAMPVQGFSVQSDLGGIPAVALSPNSTELLRFNTATTGTVTTQALGAAAAGETLVAIDFRPQTGQLYAFGVNAAADTGTLYLVDPQTGALTAVGATGQVALVDGGGIPIDLPDPATSGYGMDFNPSVDRIRITTGTGLNFRINPVTGAPVDADAVAPGSQPDGPINGSSVTGVSAVAYTNSYGQAPGSPTTVYTIDEATHGLYIQNPPNAGAQTLPIAITLGGGPLLFTAINGFDIPPGVSVTTSNTPATGFGYADLTVGAIIGLYEIDLSTGVATHLGPIGSMGLHRGSLALANAQSAPVFSLNGGAATASLSTSENSTAVATVTAIDGDFDAIAYAIVGGADAGKFVLNPSTGALAFVTAPDFENPSDADHNNSYIVQVRASDGSLSNTQTITVNLGNANEAPFITSNGGGASAAISVGENTLPVTTVTMTDVDAGTVPAYSIVGGADAAKFQINASSGALSFVTAPDFENPSDADHNNSYIVQVRASDGSLSDDQFITVNVTNLNESRSDFDANGRSDILWQHASGFVSEWLMNSGQIDDNVGLGTVAGSWHFQDTGDFNADHRADLLWRHDSGQVVLLTMNGAQVSNNQAIATIGVDWRNQGVGDFNGDGRSDVLWRNDSGQVALWTMDGAQITGNQLVSAIGSQWHIQGLLDAGGDGRTDVLLRSDSGQVVLWTMDGPQITANQSIANVSLDWHVLGTGDFNGDGRGDVLWRNDGGQVSLWTMNGAQITANQPVASIGAEWHLNNVGDYNGDGRSDVLWRNDNGQVLIWDMDGAQIVSSHAVQSHGQATAIGNEWTALSHHYDLI